MWNMFTIKQLFQKQAVSHVGDIMNEIQLF